MKFCRMREISYNLRNANFSHTFSHTSREKSEFLPNWANILHIHMFLSQVKDREQKWNWTKMYYHISGLADRFDGGNFLSTLVFESPASFNVTYDTDGWHTQTSKILREVTSVCFWLKGSWACQCICCSSRSSLLLLLFPLILSRWWTI